MEAYNQLHVPVALPSRGQSPQCLLYSEGGWAADPVWALRKRQDLCPCAPAGNVIPIQRSSSRLVTHYID
jgi:hypothetical protein